MPGFYEFFAGGGMVRAGLGPDWSCLFANDFDQKKAASYATNWGDDVLHVSDIHDLTAQDLPGQADLMWGSFPCQDLSLAGAGAGLAGARSGAFYAFWRLVEELQETARAPQIVAVENVVGALTSNDGADFEAMLRTYLHHGYRPAVFVINADLFVPQSRPRLFVIGMRGAPAHGQPSALFHPPALLRAVDHLPHDLAEELAWPALPAPPLRNAGLAEVVEDAPVGVRWHTEEETQRLLSLMAPKHLAKVREAQQSGRRQVGCLYRRTRRDATGGKAQRAEVRFDDVAGCLRTPGGGSSRQTLLIVEGASIRSRLISPRETARLMGLAEGYKLPGRYNDAYHLTGDGVVAPVVRHLAAHLFEPLLKGDGTRKAA